MLRDVDFLSSRIGKIDGAADIGDHLVKVVKDKTVAEKPIPLEANFPASPSSTEKSQADGEKA